MDVTRRRMILLIAVVAAVTLLALGIGRFPSVALRNPLAGGDLERALFIKIRAPRVVFSLLVGASLGVCGLVLQTLMNNPMVEPGFMGISQGAAFGAALALVVFSGNEMTVRLTSIAFAFAAYGMAVVFARRMSGFHPLMQLILAGMMSAALFSSGLGILKYAADQNDRLIQLNFWLMGGFKGITWEEITPLAGPIFLVLLTMYLFRWRLNLLSLDDDSSASLSVNVRLERFLFLTGTVVATALCVSSVGSIVWIGLAAPHLARRFFGANLVLSFPAAALIGAALMGGCDLIARTLFPIEIPPGVVTSLVGGALFVAILTQRDRSPAA